MFQTGSRTIFDVSKDHIGHSIEILPIEEEGIVKGVKYYCRTCSMVLLQQETHDWAVREQIQIRKQNRVGALDYDSWFNQVFIPRISPSHDAECDCGVPYDCESLIDFRWDGVEIEDEYEQYLRSFDRPVQAQSARVWDVGQGDTWET